MLIQQVPPKSNIHKIHHDDLIDEKLATGAVLDK